MSLKSSVFTFTSQDNKAVLVGKEEPREGDEQHYCVRDVQGLGAGPPALQNPIPSFHPARLGLAQVCIDMFEWDKTSVPRDCIFSLLFRDLPDMPQTDLITTITLHKMAQTQQTG